MKKLIILTTLIWLVSQGYSQTRHTFSLGFDPANSFRSGKVNDRGWDFNLNYRSNFDTNTFLSPEIGVYYESFARLNFENYGIKAGVETKPIKKFTGYLGIEGSQIHRWIGTYYTESDNYHWSYGFNSELRYQYTERWGFGLNSNYRKRTEWGDYWVYSTFLNLNYTIKNNR